MVLSTYCAFNLDPYIVKYDTAEVVWAIYISRSNQAVMPSDSKKLGARHSYIDKQKQCNLTVHPHGIGPYNIRSLNH